MQTESKTKQIAFVFMAEVKLKGLEIYRYNKQTLSKTRQMSLQKVCFCMMKHDLLQRNRYAFRKRSDKGKETKKVFHKNSSLITMAYNTLKYSALLCDELRFRLITLKVNQYQESTINAPKYRCVMSWKYNSSHYNTLIINILCCNVTSDEFYKKTFSACIRKLVNTDNYK